MKAAATDFYYAIWEHLRTLLFTSSRQHVHQFRVVIVCKAETVKYNNVNGVSSSDLGGNAELTDCYLIILSYHMHMLVTTCSIVHSKWMAIATTSTPESANWYME